MSKTLEELRTALALELARYWQGSANSGTTTTLVDAALGRWGEDDALRGAYVYILDADDAAPEGQSARIDEFDESATELTWYPPFTAAVETGDLYELYLSPLTLDQWDGCINDAIRGAWPELFTAATEDVTPTGAITYSLSAAADRILGAEVTFSGSLAGHPSQTLIEWFGVGEPGSVVLKLSRPVPGTDRTIRVLTAQKYDELAADESTDLDPEYIMEAARAAFYQRMADASRHADRGNYLQKMAHWQGQARETKKALARARVGYQAPEKEE